MTQYRKKPVVIDAVQWRGDNAGEVIAHMNNPKNGSVPMGIGDWKPFTIRTLEGEHTASVGDFIIKGVQGEFYPCKPDIFATTYEEVLPEVREQT